MRGGAIELIIELDNIRVGSVAQELVASTIEAENQPVWCPLGLPHCRVISMSVFHVVGTISRRPSCGWHA